MTNTTEATTVVLHCEMSDTCDAPVTMLDQGGFIYCTEHGMRRRDWKPCRTLRAHEVRRLQRGEQITRY